MSVMVLSRPLDVRSDDRERVLAKIQAFVVDWLDQLAGGDLPSFEEQCVLQCHLSRTLPLNIDDDANACKIFRGFGVAAFSHLR